MVKIKNVERRKVKLERRAVSLDLKKFSVGLEYFFTNGRELNGRPRTACEFRGALDAAGGKSERGCILLSWFFAHSVGAVEIDAAALQEVGAAILGHMLRAELNPFGLDWIAAPGFSDLGGAGELYDEIEWCVAAAVAKGMDKTTARAHAATKYNKSESTVQAAYYPQNQLLAAFISQLLISGGNADDDVLGAVAVREFQNKADRKI